MLSNASLMRRHLRYLRALGLVSLLVCVYECSSESPPPHQPRPSRPRPPPSDDPRNRNTAPPLQQPPNDRNQDPRSQRPRQNLADEWPRGASRARDTDMHTHSRSDFRDTFDEPQLPGRRSPDLEQRGLSIFRPSAAKVLLYPPTLITYARIAALPFLAHFTHTDWQQFTCLYALSVIADVAARGMAIMLRQENDLGRTLDVIVDRFNNVILALALANLYPIHARAILTFVAVDSVSQWVQDRACSPNVSHKQNTLAMNSLVRRYYDNTWLFAFVAGGCELLLLGAYVRKHLAVDELFERIILATLGPAVILKILISVMALWGSMYALADRHAQHIIDGRYKKKIERERARD